LNNTTKKNNKIVRKLGKELLRNCNQVIFIGDVERGGGGRGGGGGLPNIEFKGPFPLKG
jgi:hypothetical protein